MIKTNQNNTGPIVDVKCIECEHMESVKLETLCDETYTCPSCGKTYPVPDIWKRQFPMYQFLKIVSQDA